MRPMREEEMRCVVARAKWATICTVDESGGPYAIEATPFLMEDCVCFMISPRGGTFKSVSVSDRVLLKFTLTWDDMAGWAGVSCFGRGRFVADDALLARGWRLLGQALGQDFSAALARFAGKAESPLFMVGVERMTGRCSARAGEELPLGAGELHTIKESA